MNMIGGLSSTAQGTSSCTRYSKCIVKDKKYISIYTSPAITLASLCSRLRFAGRSKSAFPVSSNGSRVMLVCPPLTFHPPRTAAFRCATLAVPALCRPSATRLNPAFTRFTAVAGAAGLFLHITRLKFMHEVISQCQCSCKSSHG